MGNNINCCALAQSTLADTPRNQEDLDTDKPMSPVKGDQKMSNDRQLGSNSSQLKKTVLTINEAISIIQSITRLYLSKEKAQRIFNEAKKFLLHEMKPKELTDINHILNSKEELFYNSLINKGAIIPFCLTGYFKQKIYHYKYTFETGYIEVDDIGVYIGSWNINKLFHGYGTLYKNNQTKVEGIWTEGSLNGFGRFFNSNEEYLIGNIKNSVVNGQAIFYHNNGCVYSGEWKDDVTHGYGKETFADGSSFEGIFVNGKKSNGKFVWKDNSYFQGAIVNDLFHGQGKYQWGPNRAYEGEWKDGQMDGFGKLLYVDGSIYEGQFKQNKHHGQGVYHWNKDKYYDGQWENGKQHGKGIYYKNGATTHGIWEKGKQINSKSWRSIKTNNSLKCCLKTELDNSNKNNSDYINKTSEQTYRK